MFVCVRVHCVGRHDDENDGNGDNNDVCARPRPIASEIHVMGPRQQYRNRPLPIISPTKVRTTIYSFNIVPTDARSARVPGFGALGVFVLDAVVRIS